ncbi:hypothetical protein PINS_up002059 [Pythium insidiosum]|nr:hypothetical protein PINS_up002059 [Pythium insidiosum]
MELLEIDLAPLHGCNTSDAAVAGVADLVNRAFQRQGFLVLRNHGVPLAAVAELQRAARGFFLETPPALKAKCAYRAPVPRGYSGNRKENFAILAGNQLPNDLVEKYRMGPWRDRDGMLSSTASVTADPSALKDIEMMFYPNKWPEDDSFGLQAAMEAYYESMERLAALLFRVFERCLGLQDGFFARKIDRHTSILSVNHYPPIEKQVQKGQLRLAEHTDVDLFTILCPDWCDDARCLEVKDPVSGQWSAVPVVPEALIINIGDGLQHWTARHWVSTCHRVIVPPTRQARAKSRIAIGYFVGANVDATLSRLAFVPEDEDYDEMTYVAWRKMRVQQALDKLPPKK